jgi:hypothetical protein
VFPAYFNRFGSCGFESRGRVRITQRTSGQVSPTTRSTLGIKCDNDAVEAYREWVVRPPSSTGQFAVLRAVQKVRHLHRQRPLILPPFNIDQSEWAEEPSGSQ